MQSARVNVGPGTGVQVGVSRLLEVGIYVMWRKTMACNAVHMALMIQILEVSDSGFDKYLEKKPRHDVVGTGLS